MRYTDFMCVCTDGPRAEAEACLARVTEELEATPADLLTKVVYTMEHGLEDDAYASIVGIGCDMWCGVSVEVRARGEDGKYGKVAGIWVQCDRVEHGIARAYELAKQAVADHVAPAPEAG